jgi:hypothetical protein
MYLAQKDKMAKWRKISPMHGYIARRLPDLSCTCTEHYYHIMGREALPITMLLNVNNVALYGVRGIPRVV